MKQLTLLIITMFLATYIFAGANKNRTRRNHPMNSATLQCTQKATYTSTGSYTCDGIPYTVSVSATASATDDDCGTASTEATATAALLSSAALMTSLQAMQASCNVQ
jgi:hypothetical protein